MREIKTDLANHFCGNVDKILDECQANTELATQLLELALASVMEANGVDELNSVVDCGNSMWAVQISSHPDHVQELIDANVEHNNVH